MELNEKTVRMLIDKALEYQKNAYTPYSHFNVGAAVLGENGTVYGGCNIENASYGATICAERTAMFKMVSEGCTKFNALAVVAGPKPEDSLPCGICRQVMTEFCRDVSSTPVIIAGTYGDYMIKTILELLPMPFMKFEENS